MKSYSSTSTQGSRRGGKSRSGRYSSDRRSSGGGRGPAPAPTFWQKVVSFFTGGAKKSADSRKPSDPVATRTTEESAPRAKTSSGGESRSVRKPEAVEVTSPRLYVGNLSFDATESDLSELFSGVGQVVTAEVVSHKQTQRSKGFAFVQMQSVEEAKRAVSELHDKEFLGRKLVVSGAKNSDQHDSRSEPRFAA